MQENRNGSVDEKSRLEPSFVKPSKYDCLA